MVYRRPGRKTYTCMARTETGWKQLGLRTTNRTLAVKVAGMWETLADARAWDVLNRVIRGDTSVLELYDRWVEAKYSVTDLRWRLNDVNLEPLVDEWETVRTSDLPADTVAHGVAHIRHLLPAGKERKASTVTTEWLTQSLAAYPGKRNTRRKVHSSWSQFFEYCTAVKAIFPVNPMLKVDRPREERSPIQFYELDAVERIVGAQPTPERRAFMAFAYGSGVEVSVALRLTRADVWPEQRSVRAAGTKAHTRDRVVRVADWAWDIVWPLWRTLLPTAPLFPDIWNRWTVSDWHRETVDDLKLPRYKLHNARDHWAVWRLRSGGTIAAVQAQLGHESPTLTLRKYGRFVPSAADRDEMERKAAEYEAKRREAK